MRMRAHRVAIVFAARQTNIHEVISIAAVVTEERGRVAVAGDGEVLAIFIVKERVDLLVVGAGRGLLDFGIDVAVGGSQRGKAFRRGGAGIDLLEFGVFGLGLF